MSTFNEQRFEQIGLIRSVLLTLRRNRVAVWVDLMMAVGLVAIGLGPTSLGDPLGGFLQDFLWYCQLPWLLAFIVLANVRVFRGRTQQPWEYSSFFGRSYFSPETEPVRRLLLGRLNSLYVSKLVLLCLFVAFVVVVVR